MNNSEKLFFYDVDIDDNIDNDIVKTTQILVQILP